jgi:sodium pump decarboxylase gamma subunit
MQMVLEGFWLMVVGMFTVFAFLVLLVGLMNGSAFLFERFADRFPEDVAAETPPARGAAGEEIAVVLAVAERTRRGHSIGARGPE